MIEKKDETSPPSSSSADLTNPATRLAQSHQLLQLTACQVQAKVRGTFARLTEALQAREKQLLRQVEVLHSQQVALLQSQSSVPSSCITGDAHRSVPQIILNLDQEEYLCESILSFGKVDVEGGSLVAIEGNVAPFSVPYRVEDYQDANEDHVCLYKPLSNHSTPQQQIVQFSFAPRLKGFKDVQQSQVEALATPESTLVNSEVSSEPLASANDSFIGVHRRPSQVQQWLQQIMAETETEPSIGEQEKNFSSLSDARDAFINVAIDVLTAYKLVQSSGGPTSLLSPSNLWLLPLYILALLKYYELPEIESPESERLRNFVNHLEMRNRTRQCSM